MASKNHVDSSVAERRLRPIYNWLDEGNNKKALQEAEKVLKKQPNFQCARVLKGLALLRLGKDVECQQILEAIRKELPYDDSTLQAMTICYREMNKPEDICNVYSSAAKNDPKNEELLTHLFMAYVRVCDYKKQQQTAMTLYKLKFKNHYYFWTIMSIVMQAHEAGPELAKNLQLPLAEKMVKKFVDENKIEAEQEVQLYLLILEMQNKLGESLEVIDGHLGEMLHSYISVPTKRVELLVKMEHWKRANIEIKKILQDDIDNWSLYLNYFKTVFCLVDVESHGNGVVEEDSSDRTVNDCVNFLSEIQKKNKTAPHRLRGPYLAIMEFFVQLQHHEIDAELYFGFFTDLLLVYFQDFGSKTCCLNDLRPYLDCLGEPKVVTFLDEVWKFIELEEGQLPTSKEQMLRYISNLQITRYLGFHEKLNIAAKVQLADCLLRYYIHGAQFNGSTLLPTDVRHNDPFVVLIVEMMNDLWLETKDACYLKNALVVLEHALDKSPSNHQFKVLLIKLYNTLGISMAAQKSYDLLDIKHVQLDSMGYLQCWSLVSTGQYFLASNIFELTLKFFTSNYKDSADHLTFLYKFGSFLKINEFIEFRERLNSSLHYSAVTVEKMLLDIFHSSSFQNTIQLIEQMEVTPEKESIQFETLEDNRDLDLCWTSDQLKRRLSSDIVKTSFAHDVEFLRVRSLILRILAGAVQMINDNVVVPNNIDAGSDGVIDTGSLNSPQNTLECLAKQLTSLSSSLLSRNLERLPKNVINAPLDSRLFYLLDLSYLDLLENLSNNLIAIFKEDNVQIEKMFDHEKNPITKLSEAISKFSTECKSSDHTQLGLRCRFLNILTLLVEMTSMACMFCGVAFEIVKSQTSHKGKKGKKKNKSSSSNQLKKGDRQPTDQVPVSVSLVQTMQKLTSSALQDLDTCILFLKDKWRESMDSDKDVSDLMARFSLDEIGFPDICIVEKTMLDSYQSSLSEIHILLKVKTKYLSEIQI